MKILVACEMSGIVRRALRERGHLAYSCDLLPSLDQSPDHYIGDVRPYIDSDWDMLLAFPPCTHLCVSGARWFKEKALEQKEAIDFFMLFATSKVRKVLIENPIGIMSTRYRKPDQIIQPWMFGHGETKATCLWLKGLPNLQSTNIVDGRQPRIHHMAPSKSRSIERSLTYQGIADAIASQYA